MLTYKFYVRPGYGNSLRVRLTNNRKSTEIALGLNLTPEALADAMSPNPSPENLRYRSMISRWQNIIEDKRVEMLRTGNTEEDVKSISEYLSVSFGKKSPDEADAINAKPKAGNFLSFFTKHAEAYTRRSTRESNMYTLSVMKKFAADNDFSLEALDFEDIKYAWLSDFDKFMEGAGLSQNTRRIHFANIRAAINEACKRELTDVDPFRRFKLKKEKTAKRSLTVEELRKLFDYQPEPHAVYYRDMFKLIFMLVGINTVDLYGLKEINSIERIEYRRAKTGRLYSIKVEPEAREIIERYRGTSALLNIADKYKDHRYFRRDTNDALRLIGNVTRSGRGGKKSYEPLWPEITTYWARHTWATIARSLKISKDDIALALGHGGRTVTDIYIDEDLTAIDEANRRVLDWVLYGRR